MIQTLGYFLFACICGLAQYGILLLNMGAKERSWKVGLYGGMIGSGYSACGFLIPQVNPFPCLSFFAGTTFMLALVTASYYLAPVPLGYTDRQREDLAETKQGTIRQLGVGIVFALILATVVAFMQGQQDGQRVQQGFAGVVYRLADEVNKLHKAVTTLTEKVNKLEQKADQSAIKDSLARKQVLRNQAEIKVEINRKRR